MASNRKRTFLRLGISCEAAQQIGKAILLGKRPFNRVCRGNHQLCFVRIINIVNSFFQSVMLCRHSKNNYFHLPITFLGKDGLPGIPGLRGKFFNLKTY